MPCPMCGHDGGEVEPLSAAPDDLELPEAPEVEAPPEEDSQHAFASALLRRRRFAR